MPNNNIPEEIWAGEGEENLTMISPTTINDLAAGESKHTPGPWEVVQKVCEPHGSPKWVIQTVEPIPMPEEYENLGPLKEFIAQGRYVDSGMDDPEMLALDAASEANIRLMAAAPELYDELADLVTINMWTEKSWATRVRTIKRLLAKVEAPNA